MIGEEEVGQNWFIIFNIDMSGEMMPSSHLKYIFYKILPSTAPDRN